MSRMSRMSSTRARLVNARVNYNCARRLLAGHTATPKGRQVGYISVETNRGFYLNLCEVAKRELVEAVRVVETGLGRENRI